MRVFVFFIFNFVAYAFEEPKKCETLASLAAWKDHNTIVQTNLKTLSGTWISEGCETRPGPEYVLRIYTFHPDGSYNLIQHHYWDDSCSSSKLTISSYGKILLRNSLIQPGASTGYPKTINITVIPQDNKATKELDKLVAIECPGQNWKSWKRYEEHIVYNNQVDRRSGFNLWFTNNQPQQFSIHNSLNGPQSVSQSSGYISCLGSLKWSFNELKLVKVQFRPIFDNFKKRSKIMEAELLLGDIHSDYKRREFYVSTSFQNPLIKLSKPENITINKHAYVVKNRNNGPIYANNGKTPPHLLKKPHLPPYVYGDWTSMRCEIRPLGLYLTRKFSFYSDEFTWVGEHKFYSDPFCVIPKFAVTAAGHFTLAGLLRGTTNIDFQIERASLIISDHRMINDMKVPGFCGLNEWKVNVSKELSPTNGCLYLGIVIPSVQYDVIKVEMDYEGSWLLFFGQVDTSNFPTTSNERPTAFQLPLIKCGEITSYSDSLKSILDSNFYYNNSNHSNFLIKIQIILFLLLLPFFR